MNSNRYNIFKCHCGEPAVGAYGNNKARDDGTYIMEYYCQTHIQARGRLQTLWVRKTYDTVTNAYGMPYMKLKDDSEPLWAYLERELKEDNVQISLF